MCMCRRRRGAWIWEREVSARLGRCWPDVLGAGAFGSLADVELGAVALVQILKTGPLDGALVEEVFLACRVLNEPEPFIASYCLDSSCHRCPISPESKRADGRS